MIAGNPRIAAARRLAADAHRARSAAFARKIAPVLAAIEREDITSHRAIARALNERGVPSALGGKWTGVQVVAILKRLRGA
jgi:hypothetical protein